MNIISAFTGDHAFLSNFHPSPITIDGRVYPTVEHLFQASKFPWESRAHADVLEAKTPGRAKKVARSHVIDKERWDAMKIGVMRACLHRKFIDIELAMQLAATEDAILIEGNDWGDTFWGMCPLTSMSSGPQNWQGLNMLGILLMMQRQGMQTMPTIGFRIHAPFNALWDKKKKAKR